MTASISLVSCVKNSGISHNGLDAVKGVLITLVVIGHSAQIALIAQDLIFSIYSFHMFCFMALAFLVSRRPISYEFILSRAIRYLVPHFIFMTISAVAYLLLIKGISQWSAWFDSLCVAWFIGSGEKVKAATGFTIYWYLPSFFFLVVLIAFLKRYDRFYWPAAILLGAASLMLGVVPATALAWVPLGIPPVVFVFLPGALVTFFWSRYLVERKLESGIASLSIFLIVSIYLRNMKSVINIGDFLFPTVLFPELFFLHLMVFLSSFIFLLSIGEYVSRVPILVKIGRNSMGIFLLSQLVNQALLMGFNKVFGSFNSENIVHCLLALVVVVLVVAISLWLSCFINSSKSAGRFFFPKSHRDWVFYNDSKFKCIT